MSVDKGSGVSRKTGAAKGRGADTSRNLAAADALMGVFGMKRVPVPSEHAEAAMFMRAVRGAEADWPELRWLFAVPNGGARARKTAADLKAEGVKPGVPDYLMPVQRGGFVGLAIELKRLDGGRTSAEQREWLAHLQGQGWYAVVCRGWEEAWGVVRDYLAADFGPGGVAMST